MHSQKKRLRRTMMFLNAQRAGLVKDAYIYKPDSVIFDLEDAVAANQKDSARFQLYNTLKTIDYRGVERFVRINGVDTPFWQEDIRCAVAGGADGIRVPMCQTKQDVLTAEEKILQAEREFGIPEGRTLMMAAIETPLGVLNAYELAVSSPRVMGISIGAGDYMRTMHTRRYPDGAEMFGARAHLVIAARAADVMCFDTVYTDVEDLDGFAAEVRLIKQLGFDGKSIISPRQIPIVHEIFAPTQKEIDKAEKTLRAFYEHEKEGVGVFALDGMMIDVAFIEGAQRTIELAKASGVYKGDL